MRRTPHDNVRGPATRRARDDDRPGPDLSGRMSGEMQVDRRRGWMTDSRFTLLVMSLVAPPAGAASAPMRFLTKVTQRLRTMDKW